MKDLIKKLRGSGIDIDVVDDELELDIPDGVDVSDIIDEVKENKQRLIVYVKRIRERDDFYVIEPSIRKPHYTLSSAQKRMYVLYQFDKTSVAYNMAQFVKIEGALDKGRLESAFSQLIARHESLRTSFEAIEEEVVQKVSDDVEFEMEYYDSDEGQLPHITDGFVRPFDLSQPPLIRTGIITVSGDKSGSQPYHILMVDMHHIITDGVSQGILINDFLSLYNNEVLPKVRIQYKDYAEWQQGEKQQGVLANQKMFWLNEFSEEVTTLELPTDFVRPQVKNYQGNSISFSISKEDTLGLKALCSSTGSTMFMVVLSVYNILLSKLSNQEDVVVGTPVACRDHADLEKMIGMFVNTLPLRNEVTGSLSFREFLTAVQQKTLSCFDNQSYQYEELIDELKVGRDTSRNPLFDVLFSYQNFQKSDFEIPGLTIQPYGKGHTVSKFDLSVTGREGAGQLYFNFNYATALFKEETIERFVGYFKEIVSAIISNPGVKLSAIDVMSEAEKDELLFQFNDTTADYPRQETLVSLFEKQVSDSPENIALVYNETELTYRDLNVRANQLACYLRSQGVKEGDVVGLMLDRSIELMVALIGILKAGGTYLPLDVSQPEERIKYVLNESSALLLLTDKTGRALFDKHITTIDVSDAAIDAMDKRDLKINRSSSDLAYIIYTSGSTGTPKGVMVGHRSVINLVCSQKAMYGVDESERILQFSTIIFDASVEQIWLTLLHGASLILIDKEVITDSYRFNDHLLSKKVTHLHATPSFFDHIELKEPNSIKRIISGGEECKWELANRFNKGYKFYNKYGPSETTITSVAGLVPEDIEGKSRISIGKPVNNTFLYVLGHHLELLPRGVKGELYIGGDGLALGYVNRKELTEERFLDNPFRPGERIYKTGDLVRWLPDGNIDFIGRVDDQIKLRGYRIELGEIEHQLLSHEEVKGVVVLAREKEGDKYLVAYYVSREEIPVSTLRDHLSEKLPDYMVPTYYMHLESMPLAPSGKVDKKALPDPEVEAGEDYVGPRNETEEKLVEIWSEVLKLDKAVISVNKSFFELGGHSLKATVLVNKIFKALEVEVALLEIFTSPTIEALSKKLQPHKTTASKGNSLLTLLKEDLTTDRNLFLIHDGSGDVQGYLGLSKEIEGFNCWGLRSETLNQFAPVDLNIEELAADYIQKISKVQPGGSYQIAGWSLGGVIALEMVSQLESAGCAVDLLLMIDTVFPSKGSNYGQPLNGFSLADEKSLLAELLEDESAELEKVNTIKDLWEQAIPLLREIPGGVDEIKQMVPEYTRPMIPHFEGISIENLVIYANTIRTLKNAATKYQPIDKLNTQLIYIKATETDFDINLLAGYFKNEVIFSEIEGDHFSILQPPSVQDLVKTVEVSLENSELESLKEEV